MSNEQVEIPEMLDTYLENLGAQPLLPQSHINYLIKMKESGFNPKVIYDIGSCVCHWTNVASKIWPEAEIYLIDAFPYVRKMYERRPYKYYIGAISDKDDEERKFYMNKTAPGGDSLFQEINSKYFPDDQYINVKTITLDTLIKVMNWPLPELIKSDIQGAEKSMVEGSKTTLQTCQHMILELQHVKYNKGAPMADEVINYMDSLGWKCEAKKFAIGIADGDYHFINTKLQNN